MPDSVNWGILAPLSQEAPIRTATPQAQTSSPMSGGNPNAGVDAGASIGNAINESARTGLLRQENDRANQLQPGLLQAQADVHNKAAAEQAAMQYQIKLRQATSQAFVEGKAKGGTDGGIQALAEKQFELGDHEGGLLTLKTQQDIHKLQVENGSGGVANVGNIMANIQSQVVPDTKDPKTGQVIKGVSSLDLYTKQFDEIKKKYPDAPDPSTFKGNDGMFHDSFMVPVIATSGPIAKQQAAAIEAQKDNDLFKAQSNVKQLTQVLQNTIKTKGPTSQEAKDASLALQQAQSEARRVAVGGGFSGAVSSIKSMLPESLGGTPSTDTLVQQNSDEARPAGLSVNGQPITQSPTQGKILTVGPDGKLQ